MYGNLISTDDELMNLIRYAYVHLNTKNDRVPFFAEIYNYLLIEFEEHSYNLVSYCGVVFSIYDALDTLEDILYMEKVNFVNNEGQEVNNPQILLFENLYNQERVKCIMD